jgi:hypothetical protein
VTLVKFRRCGFADTTFGTATKLTVKAFRHEDIGLLYGSLAAILNQTMPQSSSRKQSQSNPK